MVVDEFHHAAAASYRKLIAHFRPKFLLCALQNLPPLTRSADDGIVVRNVEPATDGPELHRRGGVQHDRPRPCCHALARRVTEVIAVEMEGV